MIEDIPDKFLLSFPIQFLNLSLESISISCHYSCLKTALLFDKVLFLIFAEKNFCCSESRQRSFK